MRFHSTQRSQRGVSLLEVLISVVVFGVGALGIAGLGAFSKRASFESVQRGTAAQLAYGVLEEMRGNKAALTTYLASGTLGHGSIASEPTACDVAGANCTPAEFAAHSLWVFEQMLDGGMETVGGTGTGGLVDPSACITGPAGAVAGDYVVTVVWRGTSDLTDANLNACGAASGLYGAGNSLRRMVVVQSYINPGI